MEKLCKVKDCGKKVLARGFCRLHYDRWYFCIIDKEGNQLRELFSTKPHGESWKQKMKDVMNRPEVKEKISKKCQGLNSGEKHPMFGKHHKLESIEKMKTTLKVSMNDPAVKQQISNSLKEAHKNDPTLREKCSKARKGKPSPMKDKKHTLEARENIKKGMANRDLKAREEWIKSLSGENNPNWKGGISYMPYGFKFDAKLKEKIRNRDQNTCQLCFMTNEAHKEKFGDSLHCHHTDHDKQNCRDTNLITLCNKCNAIVNINNEYWIKYFQTLLSVIDEQNYLMKEYNVSNL
jgi:hypothetical protein